jgi:uncharacterized membrane protein YedE/YeeE
MLGEANVDWYLEQFPSSFKIGLKYKEDLELLGNSLVFILKRMSMASFEDLCSSRFVHRLG